MSRNDPPIDEPTVPALRRRAVLRGAAAATLLGAGSGLASAHEKPHELDLEALEAPVRYRVKVSGEIARGPNAEDGDEIRHGNVAVGSIGETGGVDDYRFSGRIVAVEVTNGELEARVDGERVRHAKASEKPKEGEAKDHEKERHELVLVAEGPVVDYQFVVSGDLEPGESFDEGQNDEIVGRAARGNVAGKGRDSYHYTGEIAKFHATSDDLTVLVDGETVHPDDLGEWHFLNIEAHGPAVGYEFTVSGELEPALSADIEEGDDAISDGTARGDVGGRGRDNYWFTGELTDLELSGDDVTVTVDGEVVHEPAE